MAKVLYVIFKIEENNHRTPLNFKITSREDAFALLAAIKEDAPKERLYVSAFRFEDDGKMTNLGEQTN